MTPPITVSERPHVVIRASAGSGKTYQLSSRYLDLLHQNAGPESILATTFTRKAAGEILERILRRLALAANDTGEAAKLPGAKGKPVTTGEAKAMLVNLCRSLHRVSVSTIDSFFNRIASTFRYELKLPPNPQVVDDADPLAARVRAEAIEAMLGDSDTQVLIDLLRRLHHDSTNRGVTRAIDGIVSSLYAVYRQTRREHWEQLRTGVPLEGDYLIGLVSELPRLLNDAHDPRLAVAIQKANDAAAEGAWERYLATGLSRKVHDDPVHPLYYGKRLSPAIVDAYHQLNQHARAMLLDRLARQTVATYDLLERFDGHYTRLRDQRRLLLFSDLPYKLAHEMHRGDDAPDLLTEICYRLDSSVGHLLLDEFQDTSFDQWKILRPFAEEITSFSDCSRTFFCVGDVKQAIYGWRGGRAEIFNRIESDLHLPENAQVSLAASYRSSQVVLDAVNTLFGSLGENAAWKDTGPHGEEAGRWSARFEPHTAKRERPGYVEIITSPAGGDWVRGDDEDDDALPPSHEEYAAACIAEWAHAAPGRSIGVLFTTNEAASHLIYCLRRLKVDASAEGRTRIIGEPAVDVVLAALKLADHPGDTAAAFHIVNSPLGTVIGLRSMAAAEVERVSRAVRAEVFARGYAATIADWARLLAPSCDARGALRLTQLVELAERFEPGVALRTRQFIEVVQAARVEEPVQAQVRVMTVHQAKGLEFDIVVLPQLKRKAGQVRPTATMIDRDDATDDVRAVYRGTNDETRKLSDQLEEAYRQEQVRRLRDDLCALYVAMTRPHYALHMILEPLESTQGGAIAKAGFGDQSYAALLRHGFCDDVENEDQTGGKRLFSAGNEAWHESLPPVEAGDREEPTVEAPAPVAPRPVLAVAGSSRRTWRKVAPSMLHGETSIRIADLLDLKTDESRQRGTLMHAWCRQIEWLGVGAAALPGDDVLLAQAARECEMAADPRWAAAQLAAFRKMIAQGGIIAALTRPALAAHQSLELWRERSFVVRLGGNLLRGSFDRVAILREAGRVTRAQIIDFKTDHTTRAALPALVDRYRPQIQAYREALASMLALDAKFIAARLVFLAAGESREV